MSGESRSIVAALIGAALFASAPPASAANLVVTDAGDSGGTNQLRAKLSELQSAGGGKLTFNVGTTPIVLTQGALEDIRTNTIIDGGGKVTVSGNNATYFFIVRADVTLTLANITFSHGNNTAADGGAIFNNGTLNATNCKFLDNQTTASFSGGAIISYGPLNLT